MEATPGLEPGVEVLQTSALPLGYVAIFAASAAFLLGAGDEARTRYLHLGKVALYQMSYTCIICRTPKNMLQIPWGGFSRDSYTPGEYLVPPTGIEPVTRGFSVPCSTD